MKSDYIMKTVKRTLGRGRNQMYEIKKTDGKVTYNRNEIIKVVEDFYCMCLKSNKHLYKNSFKSF